MGISDQKVRRGSFSTTMNQLIPIYKEYTKTRSFEELRRRLEESDKVMGKIYMEGERDVFSGKVSNEDGTIRLLVENRIYERSTVRQVINKGGIKFKQKKKG